ncbi:nucleotidyltransferase domain-containing protein [Candidatus Poribacteria bacterium]|nr:nucleotidyltransferase domain-containing protein [Candidatus Poribacteria bacterium]
MERMIGYSEYKRLLDLFVRHVQAVLKENVVSIVLYGSVARGEARPESDVDLLLILEETSPVYWERLQPLLSIVRQLRRHSCWKVLEDQGIFPSLSVLILSRAEANQNRYLYLDMIEDARIFVDRDGFFQSRLKVLQKRLQALGARKIDRDEGWYWDLKPDLRPGQEVIL